jgi:hypothetical protein
MSTLISWLLAISAGLVAVPATVMALEIAAAVVWDPMGRPMRPAKVLHRRVAVLVPAHDENAAIIPTLEAIMAQLHTGDRLLAVADNCTDDTGTIAAAAGAEVVTRSDPQRIGKGYALDRGLAHLGQDRLGSPRSGCPAS